MQPEGNLYYLVINGQPEGPFTIAQLKERKLKSGDFVKTEGMVDYKEAREVPELQQLFGFQKEVLMQYFAGIDQRLTAWFIDAFCVSLVCVIPVFIATVAVDGRIARLLLTVGLLIIIPLANFIYHIVMECGVKQGTYGMQIIKVKVCDLNGERLTFGHSVGRNFAKLVSMLTFGLGYLFCFFNKQQQCLHDMLAGTLVVKGRLF